MCIRDSDKNMLKNQMMGYFLNQAQKESRILDSTEVYQINQSWDPWNQNYYVDMWGSLDDGSQFLLRSPVESMRERDVYKRQTLGRNGTHTLLSAPLSRF